MQTRVELRYITEDNCTGDGDGDGDEETGDANTFIVIIRKTQRHTSLRLKDASTALYICHGVLDTQNHTLKHCYVVSLLALKLA